MFGGSDAAFFEQGIAKKYDQQQQTINNTQKLGMAQVAASRANAKTAAGASMYGADKSAQASMYGSDRQLEGTMYGADKQLEGQMYASDNAFNASIYGSNASMTNAGVAAEASMYNSDNDRAASEYGSRLNFDASSNRDATLNQMNFRDNNKTILSYKRGIARVPGTGSGDKVPALLEPGEAVLNKHAAGMIGRDKIANANKKGNDLRSKQNMSKIAAAIKMMGMA